MSPMKRPYMSKTSPGSLTLLRTTHGMGSRPASERAKLHRSGFAERLAEVRVHVVDFIQRRARSGFEVGTVVELGCVNSLQAYRDLSVAADRGLAGNDRVDQRLRRMPLKDDGALAAADGHFRRVRVGGSVRSKLLHAECAVDFE